MAAGAAPDIYDDVEDTVMTGEAVALELRPTPFVLAAAGAAIDWLIYFVGGLFFVGFVGILVTAATTDTAVLAIWAVVGSILVLVIVPTAVELLTKGKSVGRLAVGARIVRDDGGAIGFRHAFTRNLVALLELYSTIGGLAAIVGLFNGRSKRLGDLLAGTYSLYERVPTATVPIFDVPAQLAGWAQTADVARIPDRLGLRATRFLRQSGQLTPSSYAAIAAQLASELSVWVSPVPAVEPSLFVAAVVALRRDRETRAYQLQAERMALIEPTLEALPHGFPRR